MFFGKIVDRRDHIFCERYCFFLYKTSEKGPFQIDLVIVFIYLVIYLYAKESTYIYIFLYAFMTNPDLTSDTF